MAVAGREGLSYQDQLDFSGGSFPGMEEIPSNGAEDIINGVIADDGVPFRRGASVYRASADVDATLWGIWDGVLAGAHRTIFATNAALYALGGDDATPVLIGSSVPGVKAARFVEVSGFLVRPRSGSSVWLFGGDVSAAATYAPAAGTTATFTQGSRTVTGSAGAFPGANVRPGGIIATSNLATGNRSVIGSVDSTTQVTLVEPWPYATATITASWRVYAGAITLELSTAGAGPLQPWWTTSGAPMALTQIFGRLVLAQGNRIFPSDFAVDANGNTFSTPFAFNVAEEGLTLPEGTVITGMEPLRDTLLVFTTRGVWAVYGLAFADVTDQSGNPQWRMEQVTRDLVLWGEAGIASWRGSLVVPAIDDVYLFDGVSAPLPVTGGGRKKYRALVKVGDTPGQAIVHRGHYMLPVTFATTWRDQLVWRLDMAERPFTRWDGHGGRAAAYAARIGDDSRQPQLFAAVDQRVVELTNAMDPDVTGAATDADGSTFDLKVTTRTLSFGGLIGHTWRRFRARLEKADTSPVVSLEYATGKPGSAFTSVSSPQVKTDDNEQVYSWPLREKSRAIRFRLTVRSGGSREVLRSFQAGARLSSHHRP